MVVMQNLVNRLFIALFLAVSFLSVGQTHRVKLLAEVPVQFGLGYEGMVSKRFSVSAQGGLLTNPNSDLILTVLQEFGTDPEILRVVDDVFQFGLVGELGVNYNFGKNYVGTFAQLINLRGKGTQSDPLSDYFDPIPGGNGNNVALEVRSSLVQGGVLYGRRFPLKNKHFEIDAEVGVSANLWSNSKVDSERRDFSRLSDQLDEELDYYYSHYAFVPSLSVMLVYNFL